MDYHVITPTESRIVMQTESGRVVRVLPAPPSSLPGGAVSVPPAPCR